MQTISRTTCDRSDVVIDVLTADGVQFDGSAHDWFLRVQTREDWAAETGDLTFAEIAGVYTYSAGVSGYATFAISEADAALLLAGESYVFEVWYNEGKASPAKEVFVERYQVNVSPRNFQAATP